MSPSHPILTEASFNKPSNVLPFKKPKEEKPMKKKKGGGGRKC